jgi:hypothetical protein
MSDFPALRCFIFFAIDLFILLSPSFAHEAPEYLGQAVTPISGFRIAFDGINFVLKLQQLTDITAFRKRLMAASDRPPSCK